MLLSVATAADECQSRSTVQQCLAHHSALHLLGVPVLQIAGALVIVTDLVLLEACRAKVAMWRWTEERIRTSTRVAHSC